MHVAVKVYGALYPVENSCPELDALLLPIPSEEAWLFFEKDMIRISYEGIFFPVEEALEALTAFLPTTAQGKVDVIDLEDWTLTRYVWGGTSFERKTSSLNQVLEYSGH